ncbi:gp436 family protein [Undibacterium sp. Ren11W]|uniref:gp436 family protein n=1 Tax=Undibacterium sp. Ren11W TaxID=3413045 RepID=UPI003BEF54CD
MFASKSDMRNRFGDREVIALTDRDFTGAINDAVLQQGLTAADAEIAGYLAGRYTLPFAVVPAVLVGYACDIARYRLTGTEVTCTDDIQARYHQAIKYLTMAGRGEIPLGVDANGAVVGGVSATGNAVRLAAGARKFNVDSMSGY